MCPESGLKEFPGAFPREMPDVVRLWAAVEEAEVSDGRSHRGFGFSMRGTLDDVKKEIPIPEHDTVAMTDPWEAKS